MSESAVGSVRVEEVELPGIGMRYDLMTHKGRRVGVLEHCSGRRDLLVFLRGPDACSETVRMTDEESAVLWRAARRAAHRGHAHRDPGRRSAQRADPIHTDPPYGIHAGRDLGADPYRRLDRRRSPRPGQQRIHPPTPTSASRRATSPSWSVRAKACAGVPTPSYLVARRAWTRCSSSRSYPLRPWPARPAWGGLLGLVAVLSTCWPGARRRANGLPCDCRPATSSWGTDLSIGWSGRSAPGP